MKSNTKSRIYSGAKAVGLGLLASLVAASASGADERGKQLYVNCVACHGAEGAGNKLLNAPVIAGLSEKYVGEQLKKFKLGHRGGDPRDTAGLQMRPMTLTLTTDEDVAAVAAYVASLPKPSAPEETITDGDAQKGQALYATCTACHGADGKGNDLLNAPSLVGQYDWYMLKQLHNFKEGIRGANPEDISGSQMRPMAMILADEQAMKDVIAYIKTL